MYINADVYTKLAFAIYVKNNMYRKLPFPIHVISHMYKIRQKIYMTNHI
jgi:hypothetical protein